MIKRTCEEGNRAHLRYVWVDASGRTGIIKDLKHAMEVHGDSHMSGFWELNKIDSI